MSKFQVIVIAIFVICIVAGVTMFATYKSKNTSTALPPVTIWGTFPEDFINQMVSEINNSRSTALVVNYVEKDEAVFDRDFIEALATGQGPDAILVPQEMVARHENKLIAIPNEVLTERDFKNTYIPQAELYLTANREVLALPFTIDPLVMYWNRDLFTNAGIASPPRYWDEFNTIIPKINKKDARSNIQRSSIALGEFVNINNAKEILGALFIQAGNPVTVRGNASNGGRLVSTLGDGQFSGTKYSTPAVTFFTDFANPRSSVYSWNRSLPPSKSWFLSGSLATYFGFASELYDIRAKNSNLDFDVTPLPQIRKGEIRTTFGNMYGFSVVKQSPNPSVVYAVASVLTSPQALSILGKLSKLPPVRRDMIAAGSTDPYLAVFYDSALISRSWLDMDYKKTGKIFQNMVESITSGRADVTDAIEEAHDQLDLELQSGTL